MKFLVSALVYKNQKIDQHSLESINASTLKDSKNSELTNMILGKLPGEFLQNLNDKSLLKKNNPVPLIVECESIDFDYFDFTIGVFGHSYIKFISAIDITNLHDLENSIFEMQIQNINEFMNSMTTRLHSSIKLLGDKKAIGHMDFSDEYKKFNKGEYNKKVNDAIRAFKKNTAMHLNPKFFSDEFLEKIK